jgi:alpha-ribazole phosphatase
MLEILLIRHGETDFNRSKRFTGIKDIDLNSKGLEQSLKLVDALKDEVLDHIYSSDLKRCVETGSKLRCVGGRTFSEELREMSFGLWEGLTYDEIKAKYPGELGEWENDWTNCIVQEGESFSIMSKRVLEKFREIVKAHNSSDGGKIAIVSHSGCIRAILAHCIIGSINECWKFRIENATVSRLCVDKDFYYLKSLNEG